MDVSQVLNGRLVIETEREFGEILAGNYEEVDRIPHTPTVSAVQIVFEYDQKHWMTTYFDHYLRGLQWRGRTAAVEVMQMEFKVTKWVPRQDPPARQ